MAEDFAFAQPLGGQPTASHRVIVPLRRALPLNQGIRSSSQYVSRTNLRRMEQFVFIELCFDCAGQTREGLGVS